MCHYVLPLRGSIQRKKIAIKEAQRCFSSSASVRIIPEKNSLSNNSADTMQLDVAEAVITHATVFLRAM